MCDEAVNGIATPPKVKTAPPAETDPPPSESGVPAAGMDIPSAVTTASSAESDVSSAGTATPSAHTIRSEAEMALLVAQEVDSPGIPDIVQSTTLRPHLPSGSPLSGSRRSYPHSHRLKNARLKEGLSKKCELCGVRVMKCLLHFVLFLKSGSFALYLDPHLVSRSARSLPGNCMSRRDFTVKFKEVLSKKCELQKMRAVQDT